MAKLKLKNILSELLKEIGETHPVHKKINDKLMQIAKRGFDAEERETGDPDRGNAILDKANLDNVARITRGEDPIYEGEGTTNIFSKHPYIKDVLNAMVNTDGTVELQIYGSNGGLPIKQAAAIPLTQFTSKYVEKQVSQKYKINDKFREGIQQFVDSVQNKNN